MGDGASVVVVTMGLPLAVIAPVAPVTPVTPVDPVAPVAVAERSVGLGVAEELNSYATTGCPLASTGSGVGPVAPLAPEEPVALTSVGPVAPVTPESPDGEPAPE